MSYIGLMSPEVKVFCAGLLLVGISWVIWQLENKFIKYLRKQNNQRSVSKSLCVIAAIIGLIGGWAFCFGCGIYLMVYPVAAAIY